MSSLQKNIVVCLDGTGNQIEENISNVLKFYRCLEKPASPPIDQVVFYDQGVGTVGQQSTWGVLAQKAAAVWGLATGHGLDRNVLRAYEFIVQNYEHRSGKSADRDRIYIFGYSRGAHTARVLAAFIYNIGLFRREQLHLAGAALTAYKRAKRRNFKEVDEFRRIAQTKRYTVDFLGAWDTVSSMIVPRPDRFYIPTIEKLPNTRNNPGVRVFRHAMAVDEARYMFRLDPWADHQPYRGHPKSKDNTQKQDSQQVWFPGFHGDVGGGNPKDQSGVSQFALCWMIKEAMKYGLKFNTRTIDYVARGEPYTDQTRYTYPKPDFFGRLHSSLWSAWSGLEFLPKLAHYREKGREKKRFALLGFYIPLWEARHIPEDAHIHESVVKRLDHKDLNYRPKNLDKSVSNWPTTRVVVEHDNRPSIHWRPSTPSPFDLEPDDPIEVDED